MRWQNEQRNVMGMASIGSLDAVLMGTLSLPLGALFVLVGRRREIHPVMYALSAIAVGLLLLEHSVWVVGRA